jgi:hypothetical protein
MKPILIFLISLIIPLAAYSQSCLPEGITFSTQEQIDSFQVNYPGCSEIEGDVLISGTDITNLNGLNSLTAFHGNLKIDGDIFLTGLTGLENVTSVGGQFSTNHDVLTISHNDLMEDLTGLDNLTWIGGGLKIRNNESLTALTGLESLAYIGGDLTIDYNYYLADISGLEGIYAIGGSLIIESSIYIESLTPLSNLRSISGGISIQSTHIVNLAGLEGLTYIPGDVNISHNGRLTNFSGLDNIAFIGGTLDIGELAGVPNYSLESLNGLNNLTGIGKNLSIFTNEALKSLAGLNNLSSIGGDVTIIENDSLVSLSGLESLVSIQGDLRIYENNALASLLALYSLNTINGTLLITDNPSLYSLHGLDNINAGSISNLTIRVNPLLSSCEVQSICEYLSSPNGTVKIYNNDTGCNDPHEVAVHCGISLPCLPDGNYYFLSQHDIDSYQSNYPGCNNIEGDVQITGNDIVDLSGLNNITSISGSLYIQNNASLTNLEGLENLISVGEYLMIEDNPSLGSLSGLNNLIVGSLSILYIMNNPVLSYCEVEGICNILSADIETIGIQENGPGCGSRAEVEAACGVGLPDNNSAGNQLKIYPNPASDMLFIESAEKVESVSIFDSRGGQVVGWSGGQVKVEMPVRGLAPGLYLVRVETGREVVNRKIIIKN